MSRSRAVSVVAPLLALVLAVGLVVLAVRASAGDAPRAAAGDVVDPYFAQDDPTGEPVTVRVPWAELTIWADGPRERLPDDFGQEDGLLAPDGGGFVRIDVDAGLERRLVTGTVTLEQPETVLTLLADGDRIPLTGVPGGFEPERATSSAPQTRYVAVGEDVSHLDDLVLEVGYDGSTQEVALGSGAVEGTAFDEALADVPFSKDGFTVNARRAACGRPEVSAGYRLDPSAGVPTCTVESSPVLPYVQGLGPASGGAGYLVLNVPVDELALLRDARTGETVYAELRVLEIEVDGQPVEGPAWFGRPADVLTPPSTGSGVATIRADADSVPVRVVLAAVQSVNGGSAALPVTLTYDLVLEVA